MRDLPELVTHEIVTSSAKRVEALAVATTATPQLNNTTIMLTRSSLYARRSLASIAQAQRFASSLVYIEHKNGKMNDSSLHAVKAAGKLGGDVSFDQSSRE